MSVSSAVTKPLFDHFDVLVVLTHMVSTRVCSSDGNERVGERDADEFKLWALHLIIMLYKHRKCQL